MLLNCLRRFTALSNPSTTYGKKSFGRTKTIIEYWEYSLPLFLFVCVCVYIYIYPCFFVSKWKIQSNNFQNQIKKSYLSLNTLLWINNTLELEIHENKYNQRTQYNRYIVHTQYTPERFPCDQKLSIT